MQTGTTSVGTTEFWQGKEGKIIIVDFVRAGNDHGGLGFFAKKERLNVLLTRQEQHLLVIGDMTCCDSDYATAVAEEPEDEQSPEEPAAESSTAAAADEEQPAPTKNLSIRRNAWVMKVLYWFKVHGRVEVVDMDTIKEDYVTFPEPEDAEEGLDNTGWLTPKDEASLSDGGGDDENAEKKRGKARKKEEKARQKEEDELYKDGEKTDEELETTSKDGKMTGAITPEWISVREIVFVRWDLLSPSLISNIDMRPFLNFRRVHFIECREFTMKNVRSFLADFRATATNSDIIYIPERSKLSYI